MEDARRSVSVDDEFLLWRAGGWLVLGCEIYALRRQNVTRNVIVFLGNVVSRGLNSKVHMLHTCSSVLNLPLKGLPSVSYLAGNASLTDESQAPLEKQFYSCV